MNILDLISESLETTFWVKYTVLKFFYADPVPGYGIFQTLDPGFWDVYSGILNKHPSNTGWVR